jgi:hypothetical protein
MHASVDTASRQPRKWTPAEDQKLREEVEAQCKMLETLLIIHWHMSQDLEPISVDIGLMQLI